MNRKQLVKERCASFKDGMCLIRDIDCPLVTAFEYRGHKFLCEEVDCDYFEKSVLGKQNKASEGEITSRYSFKKCGHCKTSFKPKSNASKFCSTSCRENANKKSHRKYNNKRK